jgi:hypothetical protein
MKKLLILSLSMFLLNAASWAQSCTPGANYADSLYGIWPDTTQNFPPSSANVAYSTDINFKVPDTLSSELAAIVGNIPAAAIGAPINQFSVTGVSGLPTGFDYACNTSGCVYSGGANGCANIYGTTGTEGTFPITIDVSVTVLISLIPGFPTPLSQNFSFPGYKIVVGSAGVIEGIISPISVSPNPANASITVNGITTSMKVSEIILTNVEGKTIETRNMDASNNLTFDTSGLDSGIYFVHVAHANGVEIVKFMKN